MPFRFSTWSGASLVMNPFGPALELTRAVERETGIARTVFSNMTGMVNILGIVLDVCAAEGMIQWPQVYVW